MRGDLRQDLLQPVLLTDIAADVPDEYGHSADVLRMSGYSTKSSGFVQKCQVSETEKIPCSRDGFIIKKNVNSHARVIARR